jgi:hypothetical protein
MAPLAGASVRPFAEVGGFLSKNHALVDVEGRPDDRRLTGRQDDDACEAGALIEAIPEGATPLDGNDDYSIPFATSA